MRRTFRLFSAAFVAAALVSGPAFAKSRIKDIVEFEGVRDNMLVGYGLVVGLNGTGDSLRNAPFTRQSLEAMLERLGVNTRDANPACRTRRNTSKPSHPGRFTSSTTVSNVSPITASIAEWPSPRVATTCPCLSSARLT